MIIANQIYTTLYSSIVICLVLGNDNNKIIHIKKNIYIILNLTEMIFTIVTLEFGNKDFHILVASMSRFE